MKCIILCAGYATRLFPLTENFPKALLEIEPSRPLLNYIIDEVNELSDVDEIYLISNNRYYQHFLNWSKTIKTDKKLLVLNDNTNNNDDRLGAIGDIHFTINKMNIDDDLLIIAGDNLFDYKLSDVIKYYKEKNAPVVCGKTIDDIEILKSFAVAKTDENDKLIDLVEKPVNPESNIGVYATYVYPKEVINLIDIYLKEGNKPDAPGYLVEYIYKKLPTYIYRFNGNCYDVGTHESLKLVRQLYSIKPEEDK